MVDQKSMTVDDLNSLLAPPVQQGAGRAPVAPQQQPQQPQAPMSVENLNQALAPKPQPKVGFGEDFARSIGAGLGEATIGLPGMVGDIRNLVELGLQKTGMGSLGERYVPTSQELVEKAKEVMPSLKEHLEYKPEYAPSRYAKTAAQFVPSAIIPGGGLGLGARIAGGIGAGLATQGTEDLLKNTPAEGTGYETAAKIAASIPGFMVGKGAYSAAKGVAGGALTPTSEAMRRAAAAQGEDIARGGAYGAKATPAEIAATGVEMPPAAAAGKATEKLLQRSAQRVSPEVVGKYEAAIEPFREGAAGRVASYIDDLFGGQPVSALDEMAAIQSRARQINSQNYGQVMQLPHAQSIGGPQLDAIVKKLPSGVIDDAANSLRENGLDPTALGLIQTKSGWATNPSGIPLRAWDEIKQSLDTRISQLREPVTGKIKDPSAYGRWNNTVNELKTVLDNSVSEYGVVRGAAAEAAGAANAIDLGTKYLTANNPKQISFIEKTVKGMTPEQQYDFAYGVAGGYRDLITRDPKAAMTFFGGSKGGDRARRFNDALAPLGDDVGYQLIGKSNAELLNSQLRSLPVGGGTVQSILPYAPGIIGSAVQLGETLLQPALWAGNPTAFATMLVGMAGGKLYNWKEARVASKVLELMADPSKHAELGKLAAKDAAARSFIGKTTNYLGRAVAPAAGEDSRGAAPQAPVQGQPAQAVRASGGRIGRATGGRTSRPMTAEMLFQAAHKAKKKINKISEQILNEPDETVVKALSIAQREI